MAGCLGSHGLLTTLCPLPSSHSVTTIPKTPQTCTVPDLSFLDTVHAFATKYVCLHRALLGIDTAASMQRACVQRASTYVRIHCCAL